MNQKLQVNKSDENNKKYCDTTLEMEAGARTLYLLLGERLYNVREERLYEPFWSSWQEYCMEFKDFSPASISKLVSVYEVFVLKHGFRPDELAKAGGWTKLYSMLHLINSKQDAIKWLDMAQNHTRQDLGKFLTEAKTGKDMSKCAHKNTYLVRVCEDCGEKHREYESDN